MARVKSDAKPKPRSMLNTTINEEVLDDFKAYCKELGLPMNILLEAFMTQFVDGEFKLKIGKANKINVDLDNDSHDENKE